VRIEAASFDLKNAFICYRKCFMKTIDFQRGISNRIEVLNGAF
jgi:hypothetical protein